MSAPSPIHLRVISQRQQYRRANLAPTVHHYRRFGIMAAWRCMICFVFVALSLKVLLSHINASHSRSPDFWVYCGIDGCEQDFRVFNSFFRHIKRTHLQYFRTGSPPSGWSTTPSSRSLGQETFGVSVFASCSTPAADSTVAVPPGASLPEPSQQPDAVGRLESVSLHSSIRFDL